MSQLTGQQVAKLAYDAGVRGAQLPVCVAIAWAESGLRTDALGWNHDPVTGERTSRDRGLWQINDYWHPDVSDACAFDATCNAQAMYRISSHGTNWVPWSTFNSGAFNNYFLVALVAVQAMLGFTQQGAQQNPVEAMLAYLRNGGDPLHAIIYTFQRLVDETMDNTYGPGNRPGPVLGGIIK